jgi:HPt (histidine-containing phosphotransfer) domain-containing protein
MVSSAFDQDELMERIDDDVEFLEETITMLDEDGPEMLDQIRAAAGAKDAAALVTPAHALKGMLANFCATSAEAAARDLEVMGREARLEGVDDAVARLEQETDRLSQALHEFLRTKVS